MTRQSNLRSGNTPHRVAVADAARDGRVRRRVVEIYARAAADWMNAPHYLARAFRGVRELRSHERRFLGEAIYGLVRWRRLLAFSVGDDNANALQLYLAWLEREFPAAPEEAREALGAELRAAGVDRALLAASGPRVSSIADERERLGVRESYPDWIVARIADERGLDEAARLLAAMNRRAPLTARANRLKNTREELAARLTVEGVGSHAPLIGGLAPDGLELETHLNAYGLQAFKEGRFELQDAGSQAIAELVAPPPRGLVLDACAGAGGKTLALGALLGNRGRLYATDPSERKLAELRERARRAGLTNARAVALEDSGKLPQAIAELSCDRVLADAPCSGLGVLRRNPEARWRLQPGELDELQAAQRRILDTYAPLVAAGGRLVYATCSVLAAENDAVFDAFLAAHAEFEEVPAKEILGSERARAIGDGTRLRLLPHVHDTDGFFAAVARRRR